MYKRNVDDINVDLQETPVGAIYWNGQLEIEDALTGNDLNIAADARILRILREVGNSVHKSIQLEVEHPSKRNDGKMPILDTKI